MRGHSLVAVLIGMSIAVAAYLACASLASYGLGAFRHLVDALASVAERR